MACNANPEAGVLLVELGQVRSELLLPLLLAEHQVDDLVALGVLVVDVSDVAVVFLRSLGIAGSKPMGITQALSLTLMWRLIYLGLWQPVSSYWAIVLIY